MTMTFSKPLTLWSRTLDWRLVASLGLTLASGVLLALSYGLHPIWQAAWIAPAPVLAAAVLGPRQRSFAFGAAAGLIAAMSTFSYYGIVAGWPIACLLAALRAVGWGGAIRTAAAAAHRWPAFAAAFVLPVFWTALETLLIAFSPHSSAGSLAYSQMDALPVIQVAALGGAPAIVFVVLCAGSLGGLVLGRTFGGPGRWRDLAIAAALVAALVAASLAYGLARLTWPADARGPEAALIVTDQFPGEPKDWAEVWRAYGPAAAAAATPGALVVLPEKIALLSPAEAEAAAADLAGVARRHGAVVVAGIEVRTGPGAYANRAAVAGPDGRVSWYDKQHLVPGLESRDAPGHTIMLSSRFGLPTGVAICKDMHFPSLGRAYAAAGARIMLVPAWDFFRDGWLSDRLTALRGVEGGYAIARTSREGVSSVSDQFGRILAEATSGRQVTVLRAPIPIGPLTPTLYGRIGDAFGWLAVAAAIGGLVLLRRRTP